MHQIPILGPQRLSPLVFGAPAHEVATKREQRGPDHSPGDEHAEIERELALRPKRICRDACTTWCSGQAWPQRKKAGASSSG
ncbi:hypothetical protein EKO27_g10320 [Xylaria grammica]|uniref:Uncharacterized protein n=1 Tax=Xylaria grammica TaxID=363999 RepID=A0A439CRI7_9PEZI|nr:hypothetical protein EKO27_g10320 [Xylaria grammica]